MILWTTHRFIRYLLCLFVSVLFANVNASWKRIIRFCNQRKYDSRKMLARSCILLPLIARAWFTSITPHPAPGWIDCYVLILDPLHIYIRRKCLELIGCWIPHQDNTCPPLACLGLKYLEKHNIRTINHPPYSPDLSSCDFWLFPTLKCDLLVCSLKTMQKSCRCQQLYWTRS